MRLCISAVGALVGSLVRKTAVPGTVCGGLFSSMATSAVNGVSSLRVFSNRMRLPRRHVYITMITMPPSASGIHPPSTILSMLADRNVRSITRNGPMMQAAASGDHFHTRQMTRKARQLVTTIVPVTAMP